MGKRVVDLSISLRNCSHAAGAVVAAVILSLACAKADDASAFYKATQINLVVGSGVGGGYDAYARVLAHHIGRYIPGHPTIVVQNMPGAGGLRAANYLYNVAPKDGSTIGTFAHDLALVAVLGHNRNIHVDFRNFTWLGSSSSFADDAYVLIVRPDAAAKTVADARRRGGSPLLVGASSGGGGTSDIAILARDVLGLNLKPISGYSESNQLFLAIDRKEIDGRLTAISVLRAMRPGWLKPGAMHILLQFARSTRHPALPDVPTARELAPDDFARSVIQLAELPYRLDRPFAAPPGIPASRARALQTAFVAVHKDKQYLDEAHKLQIEVSPVDGAGVLRTIERMSSSPRKAIDYLGTLFASH